MESQAEPFFITGLPRSRTAWLANLLTCGPAFCHHDAIRLGVSAAALKKLFTSTESEFVGDSDSGLLSIPYELNHHFPKSRWVLIGRDADQVAASYQKHFTPEPYPHVGPLTDDQAIKMAEWCMRRLQQLASIIPDDRKLVVRYGDLEKEDCIKAIWKFCLPSVPFNRQRWLMLDTFRVNIIGPKVSVAGDLIEQMADHVWDLK